MRKTQKVHIVTYSCEQCGARHNCVAGVDSDGICAACGFPMRIADLFEDRRSISAPVLFDRRELSAEQAA